MTETRETRKSIQDMMMSLALELPREVHEDVARRLRELADVLDKVAAERDVANQRAAKLSSVLKMANNTARRRGARFEKMASSIKDVVDSPSTPEYVKKYLAKVMSDAKSFRA